MQSLESEGAKPMKIRRGNLEVRVCVGAFLFLGFFLGTAFSQQSPKGWKRFTSAAGGYVAYYPSNWYRFPPSNSPMLNIYDFPFSRAGGGVLPDGGASIALVPPPPRIATIEDWIKADDLFGRESMNSVTLQRTLSKKPLPVTEVISPGPEGMENVNCYFDISGKLLVARLEYWKGDPSAMRYRAVLHQLIERTSLIQEAKSQSDKN
jgi:hypothetical protein